MGGVMDVCIKGTQSNPQTNPPRSPRSPSSSRYETSSSEDPVMFNTADGHNGIFSTHYASMIYIENKKWPTVEHYVQAHKFVGKPELMEEFRQLATAEEAKHKGRNCGLIVRPDWEAIRDKYMKGAQQAKFFQHYDLRSQLLKTGNRQIIFDNVEEPHWGTGPGGLGENMLGKILMELRADIRAPMPSSGLAAW